MNKKSQRQRRNRKSGPSSGAVKRLLDRSAETPAAGLAVSSMSAAPSRATRLKAAQANPQRLDVAVEDSADSAQSLEIGMAALRRRRFSEARDFLEQAASSRDHSAAAHSGLSLVRLGLGDLPGAEADVERAVELGLASCGDQLGFGVEMFREQDFVRAEASFRLAVRIQPQMCETHNNLANASHRLGKFEQAVQSYNDALQIQPRFAAALYNRGVALKQLGRLDQAFDSIESAIGVDPNHVDAMCNLGQISQRLGRLEEALTWFQRAAGKRPENADFALCIGNVCLEMGSQEAAAQAYLKSLELRPDHVDTWNNLGACQVRLGCDDEAQACFEKVRALAPTFTPAIENLADLHVRQGRLEAAIKCYQDAIEINDSAHMIWMKEGRLHTRRKDYVEADRCFRAALRLRPGDDQPLAELGMSSFRRGLTENAAAYFQRAIDASPTNTVHRLHRASALPVIYDDLGHIERTREELIETIAEMSRLGMQLNPFEHATDTLFYLAYQGRNDRDIQTDVAALWRTIDATQGRKCDLSRPLRVGFLTRYLTDHTVGMLTGGLMALLDNDRFRTVTLALDDGHPWFQANTDEFRVLPNDARQLAATVAAEDIDVLVYPEIGMDPLTNIVARMRLAPVQCVMWGHPVTTGMPSIDYFLSSELLESDEADSHYSEELIRLKSLPAYYFRPSPPNEFNSRCELGLPESGALYGCPQSLFKIHPDMDVVFDRILDRDRAAHVVLIEGNQPNWTERLRQRFARTVRHVDRIVFLPRLSGQDFYGLLEAVDIMLDPLHFGGGRSNYLTLSTGTPLVTRPAELMRGRVALGMYNKLEYQACVVADVDSYVEKAIQLGRDSALRRHVGDELSQRSDALFEESAAISEFEQFLVWAATRNADS